jgi:dTMP kinase
MKKTHLDAIWERVESLPQSPSHDREHLERVLGFAKELQARHGGDYDVVTAAALLHDIGRADVQLPSAESARVAANKAEAILEEVGFPAGKIARVCSAIRQHDQEDLIPDSIEAKIIKEADYLAGFGAWGILRIAMFQGERGRSVSDVLQRLRDKMPARIASLEFPESRLAAAQEHLFVELFLALLDRPPLLSSAPPPGKYVAFEGISGSGKDTQASLLLERLRAIGKEIIFVSEPSDRFRSMLRQAPSPEVELYILLADRSSTAQSIIRPSLEAGKVIVASRSYVSSLVYQPTSENNSAYIRFLHRSLPSPDLIVLLDVPAECAYDRLLKRSRETGKSLGKNESPQTLARHRERFLEAVADINQAVVIDGAPSKEEVAEKAWQNVEVLFENYK